MLSFPLCKRVWQTTIPMLLSGNGGIKYAKKEKKSRGKKREERRGDVIIFVGSEYRR